VRASLARTIQLSPLCASSGQQPRRSVFIYAR
jgi:hypothetical protein